MVAETDWVLKPVKNWIIAPVEEKAIILRVEYADSEEDLKSEGSAIHFVMLPNRCLELAEALTKHAARLLDSPGA